MNKTTLRERSKKELSTLARRRGIAGWETMTKVDLIEALLATNAKSGDKKSAKSPATASAKSATNGNGKSGHSAKETPSADAAMPKNTKSARPATPSASSKPSGKAASQQPVPIRPEPVATLDKNIASRAARAGGVVKDQIVLTVPDPYWLHVYWQLSLQSIQRAEAALGQDWHGSRPVLRAYDVTSHDTTSTSEAVVRDVEIHGGCNHWYIDIPQPPRSYRVDIGYRTRGGRFFPLCRSNIVTPPKAGATESLEENWTNEVDDKLADRYLAAATTAETGYPQDDAFRRANKDSPFGPGAALPGKLKKFFFDIDAQLIVVGRTDPSATVTLNNEAVKLHPDGTFAQRYTLPDSRQIIPAVATSSDGMEEQTIVLAIERNTKRLDPILHDLYGDS
ncbi:MAG: DUF4912 domain-containing protein [Bacteroidales bacterium]|nr:DUF4912 domain-containing protein [Bacteroidales bacterium]